MNDWLIQDPRPDWVNKSKPTDRDDISFGCGLIFLYYLQTQLQLWMPDFLQAGKPWPIITTGSPRTPPTRSWP